MDISEFLKKVNNRKEYRELPIKFKSTKFLNLYFRMFTFCLNNGVSKDSLREFLRYLTCFFESRDFHNWHERIYTLLTKKISPVTYLKFKLKYNSKADYYYSLMLKKRENTSMIKYGTKAPQQNKNVIVKTMKTCLIKYGTNCTLKNPKVKQKSNNTCQIKYGANYFMGTESFKQKSIETCIKKYNCKNVFQSEEVKEKIIQTSLERYGCENPSQSEEVKEKRRQTNLERYGVEYPWIYNKNSHSKIADEFCINLYTKLSDNIKPYCIFFKKSNKEYMLRGEDRVFKYDFTIFSESIKIIIEFDGLYWHGLLEGQKDVRGVPVEEVWRVDEEKERLAEMNGFKVIRVREDEYIANKEEVLNNIMKEILV